MLRQFVLLSFFLILASNLGAQGVVVIQVQRVMPAAALSGMVTFGAGGQGMPDVTVEDCTSGWKRVMRSVQTNEHGLFSFPHAKRGGVHYLRVSHRGANTLLVKVRVGAGAHAELVLNLEPST